jgi:CRP-like cAMP-binding protein
MILGYQDDGREVFFIIGGRVRVTFFSKCGREVSFRDLPAGEMFGELSAIDGLPRSCTVVALADTMVAIMSASVLWDLLREHESVNACLLRRLTRLVRALSERVVEFSTLTVRKRIQVELLRLAREAAPGQKSAVISPAPTHAEFASRVSTHREAVTRGLGELARGHHREVLRHACHPRRRGPGLHRQRSAQRVRLHRRESLLEVERDHFEACTVGFFAQMSQLPKRRSVVLAAGTSCKHSASSDEEARPRYGLGMGEMLKSLGVALDSAPVFGLE